MSNRPRPWPWPCFALQEIGNTELYEYISSVNPPEGSILFRDLQSFKIKSRLYSSDVDEFDRHSPRFGSKPNIPNSDPDIQCVEGMTWKTRYFNGDSKSFRQAQKELLSSKNIKIPNIELRVIYDDYQIGYQDLNDMDIEGKIIAGYKIGHMIGKAAHSLVFLAESDSGPVSIKVSLQNTDSIALSLSEIHVLKLLNMYKEDSIINMIDYFFYRGRIFMVCELLGPNLYDLYSGAIKCNHSCGLLSSSYSFTIMGISKIAKTILIALSKLSSLGIFHGDIKPENVLTYCRKGNCDVKLIDFGSSRFICEITNNYQQSRPYRAPEVVLGLPYDMKADLWSLGAMLAELWIGRLLFPSDNNATLLSSIISLCGEIPDHMITSSPALTTSFFVVNNTVIELGDSLFRVSISQKSCLKSLLKMTREVNDEVLESFKDLLERLLTLDPTQRPDPEDLLNHPFIKTIN